LTTTEFRERLQRAQTGLHLCFKWAKVKFLRVYRKFRRFYRNADDYVALRVIISLIRLTYAKARMLRRRHSRCGDISISAFAIRASLDTAYFHFTAFHYFQDYFTFRRIKVAVKYTNARQQKCFQLSTPLHRYFLWPISLATT